MRFILLLQILFIGLKLAGVITWSWFLVLIPLMIDFIVTVLVGLLKAFKPHWYIALFK